MGNLAVERRRLPVWPFVWRVVVRDATTGVWQSGYSGWARSRARAEARMDASVDRTLRFRSEYG